MRSLGANGGFAEFEQAPTSSTGSTGPAAIWPLTDAGFRGDVASTAATRAEKQSDMRHLTWDELEAGSTSSGRRPPTRERSS